MEIKRARFIRPEGIRTVPYNAGKEQADSIDGVAELEDGQKRILYRLAEDLIVLEDIGRPQNMERMRSNPFQGPGTLEELVKTGKHALALVRDAMENNIPSEIIGEILDRDSLDSTSR